MLRIVLQDTKKVQKEVVAPKVALPDSDQEDRGSQSPSSFGSAKENVPQSCNQAATRTRGPQKAPPALGVQKRSTRTPVLKTPALA